jgi:hypothetical protein
MRASGPFYPAVCLQTMLLGEHANNNNNNNNHDTDDPNVILLEFMLRAQEGLQELATRIRTRFPHAIVLFLDLYYPRMVRVKYNDTATTTKDDHHHHVKKNKESITLQAYQKKMGYKSLHDATFLQHLATTTTLEMYLNPRSDLSALQDRIASSVQGYIWRMPYPKDNQTMGSFVAGMADYWSDDYKHLSKTGHEHVAKGLHRLLRGVPQHHETISSSSPKTSWEASDHCANWLLTGQLPHTILNGMEMKVFDPVAKKYGLEVSPSGGSLQVENPYPTPATMYWTYMVTGDDKYPAVKVTINGGRSSVEITPRIEQHVHISQTKKIGLLPPGSNTITFTPLSTSKSEWPFRLVASSLSQVDISGEMEGFNVQAQAEQNEESAS